MKGTDFVNAELMFRVRVAADLNVELIYLKNVSDIERCDSDW